MSASTGLYEQIKTDLGYLQLDRAGEVFATLAEDARTHQWTHIEFLARLLDEQAGSDGDTLIILLGGGTKDRQQRDIVAARELWQEYKRRKDRGD